jgi:hypothetical protein
VTPEALQQSIDELANFPPKPAAAWIAKVEAAPSDVIIGAILLWVGHGSMSAGVPDTLAPRREAAQALLQARLSSQIADAATRLHTTIDSYQQESSRQTNSMLLLTKVIAWLTAIMLVAVVVQIVMALRGKLP